MKAQFTNIYVDILFYFTTNSTIKWKQDTPSDELFEFMRNHTSDSNSIYRITNSVVYICVGRPQTNSSVVSTFVLVELTNSTQSLNINDHIYADQTLGLLERIQSLQRFRVNSSHEKVLIQTELVACGDLGADDGAMLMLDDLHTLNAKSELSCAGGINSNLSMYIVDASSNATLNLTEGMYFIVLQLNHYATSWKCKIIYIYV